MTAAVDPLQPIPGTDPGACPECGGWRKAGMLHECSAADPLQQIRETLEWLSHPSRLDPECIVCERTNGHDAQFCPVADALDALAGLRLLPDGHAAVPIDLIAHLVRDLEQVAPNTMGSYIIALRSMLAEVYTQMTGGREQDAQA